MKKILICLFVVMMVISTLYSGTLNVAYAETITSEDNWVAAYPNNFQNDYLQDQQTGSGTVSQDIVGDADYPSTYMRFSATEIDFRIRLNDIDGTAPDYEFKNFAFIGIDADLDGGVDFFLGIYNPTGNNGRLGIYGSADGYLNVSPSTTGIDGKPLMAFEPVLNENFSLTVASGSNFNLDTDYFISFKFTIADIEEALAGTGITFTSSTPFRFMTGTAAQDNSFNQDLNGMNEDGWSSDDTWEDLGVFTDIVSPDGSATYYVVTFDKNTGDTEANPQIKAVASGSALGTLPTQPTKRGMYFVEWNTAADGSGSTVDASTIINSNITVYAVWTYDPPGGIYDQYTVTFNTGTGAFSDSTTTKSILTQTDGTMGANMPSDPIDGTDLFVGWVAPDGTYFSENTLVTADITVTAEYTKVNNNYRAYFYDNLGTTAGGSLVVAYASNGGSGSYGESLPDIYREGYEVEGWYSDIACTTFVGYVGGTIPTAKYEAYYYAKWVESTGPFTVNYIENLNGSTTVYSTTIVNDGLLGALPAEPTAAGYEFIEWNREPDGSGEAVTPTSEIRQDTDLYGIWRPIYNVTFYANSDGGSVVANGFFDDGTTITTSQVIEAVDNATPPATGDLQLEQFPQPPSRDNYTFMGWSTTANGTTPVDLTNLDYSVYNSLYAIWTPVYTVTFNENYGTTPATKDVLTAYERVLYIPEDPTRDGYNFVEWTTLPTGGTTFDIDTAVTSSITVYAQWNGTPDAVDDMAATPQDTPVLIAVLANDTDPEGDTLSVSSVSISANGVTPVINGNTTLTYTPPAGFTGMDAFTYTISDGNGGYDTATVTVYVNTNAPPTAVDDSYTTDEDTVLTISDVALGVLANDSDIDGTINVLSYDQPTHGSVTLNANGTFTYTPNANYNGPDSFEYTIEDDDFATATATVNITVTPVNDTPLAADDSYSTNQDTTLTVNAASGVLTNDTIGDGLKSIAVATGVSHGSLTLNADGSFEYIPAAGYAGADSFTYTITDTDDETSTATVNITVNSTAVYHITYLDNDGDASTTPPTDTNDYSAGATATLASAISRTGYTFAGWNDGSATYAADYNSYVMPAANVTFTAQWTANDYNVTYAAGATGVTGMPDPATTSHATDSTVTISSSEPSRDGYTFAGWTTSFDSNTYDKDDAAYDDFTMPAEAVTLTAQWTANSYNVTYAAGATGVTGMPDPATTSHATDSTVTISSSEPARDGYTFAGWTTSFDSNTYDKDDAEYDDFTMPAEAVTLTAQWTANNYNVTYAAGATGVTGMPDPATTSHSTDSTVTISSSEPSRDGYTFAGWTTSFDSNTYDKDDAAYDDFTMPAEAVTLTAQWTANSYNVTYAAGATGVTGMPDPATTSHSTDSTVTISSSEPSRDGYTFAGWTTSFDSNTYDKDDAAYDDFTMPAEAVTLTAQWTANDLTVTHVYNDGATANTTGTETVGSTYSNLPSPDPTRAGYTFDGWELADGTPIDSSVTVTETSDHSVYAQWTANTNTPYTIEHYQQDTTGPGYTIVAGDTQHETGTTDTTAVATPNIYEGFSYNLGASTASGTITGDGNLVLTLYYDRNTHSVTYNANGGDPAPLDGIYRYDATVTVGAAPTRDGYTFGGWNNGTDSLAAGTTFQMPNTNVTFVAVWLEDLSVSYNANGGSGEPTDAAVYHAGDTVIVSSTEPTWDGYTFDGWLYDGSTYWDADEITMPASDITLTAQWTLTKYTVTLDKQSGTGGTDSVSVANGSPMPAATAPTRDGFVFDGYYSGTDGTGTQYYDADMNSTHNWDVEGSGTIYASWLPVATGLTVTPESSIINVGQTVALTATITPDGSSHDPIVWSSSDTSIATVDPATGVVTGVDVGRVVITATSGSLSDTAIVEVQSEDADDPDAPTILVEGDIFYVTDETPIPGIDITMYSTPKRDTTNADGYFYLGYVAEGIHTLTAESSPGTEIGRIPVTLTKGVSETYILHPDGSLEIVYNDNTERIFIRLMIPRPSTTVVARDVIFISGSSSSGDTGEVTNPNTGDDSTFLQIIWQKVSEFFSNLFG